MSTRTRATNQKSEQKPADDTSTEQKPADDTSTEQKPADDTSTEQKPTDDTPDPEDDSFNIEQYADELSRMNRDQLIDHRVSVAQIALESAQALALVDLELSIRPADSATEV